MMKQQQEKLYKLKQKMKNIFVVWDDKIDSPIIGKSHQLSNFSIDADQKCPRRDEKIL